jgi:site-specific recombinase XerD
MANRIVTLYRTVKISSGKWSPQPIADRELKDLKNLPEHAGNYYLSYYEAKSRRMPSVGRFADAARQALAKKRRELENRALGLPVFPEPEPQVENSLADAITKFLTQQQAMVGNDGYGAARKTVKAYTSRLEFYKEFCASKRISSIELKDTDHLWDYVAWLRERRKYTGKRKQRKRNGAKFSDRYVHNVVSTVATFALTLDIDTVSKKILKKLGYAKKEILAYSGRELNLLWAAMTPDEELLYKFFLWSMGRDQEVATREVRDLDFVNNTVHFSPKRKRQFRLKSKRNWRGNVGDRYVPLHPNLMVKLREYIDRTEKKDDDLLFPALNGGVEQHFLRRLEDIVKRTGLKLSHKAELHRFRKTGATLHYNGGQGVPLATICLWLGHSSLQQTEEYLDVKATAPAQDHIREMVVRGALAAHM